MRFPLFFCCCLIAVSLKAQPVHLSGIINHYAAVAAFDSCSGRFSILDTAGFRPGEQALLIQMQGAAISTANNASYGAIIALNSAGRYEVITIDSVVDKAVYSRFELLHAYDWAGSVQLVTYPHYTDAVVTDTLRALPWDGAVGGVLALSVADSLVLNAPVVVDGAGFRGGAAYVAPSNNCTWLIGEDDFVYGPGNWRGSYKGEGVAAFDPDKVFGRGAQANGGGGGNDHNAGGGGGGNTTQGGLGGENDEPSTFGCDGYFPGLRGRALPADTGRLYLGGGGGAGHANNNLGSTGGTGGGIVFLESGYLVGTAVQISANGKPGGTANGDGGGGGGGGGTIWLKTGASPVMPLLLANGGNGGNTVNNNLDRCFGPGGGGSGGRLLTNLPGMLPPAGGLAGMITGSSNACNGSSSGAEAGAAGLVQQVLAAIPESTLPLLPPQITAGPDPLAVCVGDPVVFAVKTNAGNWLYQWEMNTGTGWSVIGPGQGFFGFESAVLTTDTAVVAQNGTLFRCIIRRPGCSASVSPVVMLTVGEQPQANFTAQKTGNQVVFVNTSSKATSFLWDFGDGTTSNEAGPTHIYNGAGDFTVTLFATSPCGTDTAVQTLQLLASPVAAFVAPDSVIDCEIVIVNFQNTSSPSATAFYWQFPGGMPATSTEPHPQVRYTASGIFPVVLIASNAAGADTTEHLLVVRVIEYPQANFIYTISGDGKVAFTDLSQNAENYTWYFGDSTATASTPDVVHQYDQSGIYTVTLVVDNYCGTAILQKTIEVVVTGLKTPGPLDGLAVFPNPAAAWIMADCSSCSIEPERIRMYDEAGRLVLEKYWGHTRFEVIPVEKLAPGRYRLQVQSDRALTERIVIILR